MVSLPTETYYYNIYLFIYFSFILNSHSIHTDPDKKLSRVSENKMVQNLLSLNQSPSSHIVFRHQALCCNIFVFYFNIKDLIYFCVPFVQCVLCGVQGICMHGWVKHLCLSAQSVTKHGNQSPSLMGIIWVSDGVGINFVEYMRYKSVHFYGSLEQMVIVDS